MMFRKSLVCWSVAGALLAMAGGAAASGFALIEQSGSGLGNAFAGGAASAEDASTIFFNPAGMSRLSGKQFVFAAHAIRPSAKFSNSASVAATLQPTLGGAGGDAGSWALVPNAYFAMEVSPQTHIGLGINAPFGLQTSYDPTWAGRFQAIKSKIETINLNPSVSYQVNDSVSIGAGLNYQQIKGNLSSAINWAAIAFSAAGGGAPGLGAATALRTAGQGEGTTIISGNDAAWGYNLGMMFKPSPQTRVGLAYRSSVSYNLSGSVSFANRPSALVIGAPLAGGIAAAVPDGAISLAIKMPDSFSVSGFHQLNDKWDVMADATWTGWSVLQQLKIVRANGNTLLSVPENWKDTWRVAVGSNYHYNESWTARMGVAYDQSPVSDAFRTARIPDNNRIWLSLGGQYKPSKDGAFDFGYSHLFVSNATISDIQNVAAQGKASGNLIGSYSNSVDILSVQYAHSF